MSSRKLQHNEPKMAEAQSDSPIFNAEFNNIYQRLIDTPQSPVCSKLCSKFIFINWSILPHLKLHIRGRSSPVTKTKNVLRTAPFSHFRFSSHILGVLYSAVLKLRRQFNADLLPKGDQAQLYGAQAKHKACPGGTVPTINSGQNRALAPDYAEPRRARKLLPTG